LRVNAGATLSALGFNNRVCNALAAIGIHTIDALCSLNERELRGVHNIGRQSMRHILATLEACNRKLSDHTAPMHPAYAAARLFIPAQK
jgi:DNA-directed RNA polymerase alpha subunit